MKAWLCAAISTSAPPNALTASTDAVGANERPLRAPSFAQRSPMGAITPATSTSDLPATIPTTAAPKLRVPATMTRTIRTTSPLRRRRRPASPTSGRPCTPPGSGEPRSQRLLVQVERYAVAVPHRTGLQEARLMLVQHVPATAATGVIHVEPPDDGNGTRTPACRTGRGPGDRSDPIDGEPRIGTPHAAPDSPPTSAAGP